MAATGRYTNRPPTQTMGADYRDPIQKRFMDALRQVLEAEMTMLRDAARAARKRRPVTRSALSHALPLLWRVTRSGELKH